MFKFYKICVVLCSFLFIIAFYTANLQAQDETASSIPGQSQFIKLNTAYESAACNIAGTAYGYMLYCPDGLGKFSLVDKVVTPSGVVITLSDEATLHIPNLDTGDAEVTACSLRIGLDLLSTEEDIYLYITCSGSPNKDYIENVVYFQYLGTAQKAEASSTTLSNDF